MAASDAICVPIRGQDERVEIQPHELPDDVAPITEMLMGEMAPLDVWRRIAVEYYRQGKTDQMLSVLELGTSQEAERQYPDAKAEFISLLNMLAAFKLRAAMLTQSERERKSLLDAAMRALNRADHTEIHRTDYHTTTWVTQGFQAMANNEKDNALSFLQTAFTVDPDNVPAKLVHAAVLYRSGEYPKASSVYARLIRDQPGVPASVRVALGMCQYRMGNTDAARAAMDRALELEPENVSALVNLAVLHLSMAAEQYRRLGVRRGGSLTVEERKRQKQEARAEASSHARRATKLLERAYGADPTHPLALLHLANQFFWQWKPMPGATASVSLQSATLQTSRDLRASVARSRLVRVGDRVYSLHGGGHSAAELRLAEPAHKLPSADPASGVVRSADGKTVRGARVEVKDFEKTLALARQALQHTQNTLLAAEAEYFLGRVHHSNGDFDKAAAHYEKAVRAFDRDPQSKRQGAVFSLPLFGLAQLHLRAGRLPQAQQLLEQLRKQDAKDTDAAHLLSYIYSKHSKHQTQAQDLLRRVLEQRGSDPEILVEQAQLLYRAGGRKGELAALRKLTLAAELLHERGRRVPVELLNNVAALKHRGGDHEGALAMYAEAMKEAARLRGHRNAPVDPASVPADASPAQRFCLVHGIPRSLLCAAASATITFNLACVLDDAGDPTAATSFLQELLRGYPTHADALTRLGRIAERRHHVSRAADLYKKAAAAAKETWKSQGGDVVAERVAAPTLMLGALRLRQGQASVAQQEFESVLARKPTAHDTYARLGMGSVYLSAVRARGKEQKNAGHAKRFFEGLLKSDPKNMYAANGLGVLLAKQGHFDEALAVFTAVHESATWFQDAWINLAHVLALKGNHFRAINLYKSAEAKFCGGEDVALKAYIAAAQYSAQDFLGAERTLRAALRLAPHDLRLWYNLAETQMLYSDYVLAWGANSMAAAGIRDQGDDAQQGKAEFTFRGMRTRKDLDRAIAKHAMARRTASWLHSLAAEAAEGAPLPFEADMLEVMVELLDATSSSLREHLQKQDQIEESLRRKRELQMGAKERAALRQREEAMAREEEERRQQQRLEEQRKKFEEEMQASAATLDSAMAVAKGGGKLEGRRPQRGRNAAAGMASAAGPRSDADAANDDVDALLGGAMVPSAGALGDSDDDDDVEALTTDLFGDGGKDGGDGGEDDMGDEDDGLFGGLSREQEDEKLGDLFDDEDEDGEEEGGGSGGGQGAGAGAGEVDESVPVAAPKKRSRVVDEDDSDGGDDGGDDAASKRQRQA